MNELSFNIANNWNEFPELKNQINWQHAKENKSKVLYVATSEGNEWGVRMNNFPDEPCFTLLINKKEVLHFDDWPLFWLKPK